MSSPRPLLLARARACTRPRRSRAGCGCGRSARAGCRTPGPAASAAAGTPTPPTSGAGRPCLDLHRSVLPCSLFGTCVAAWSRETRPAAASQSVATARSARDPATADPPRPLTATSASAGGERHVARAHPSHRRGERRRTPPRRRSRPVRPPTRADQAPPRRRPPARSGRPTRARARVEGDEAAQIDHLGVDPFPRQAPPRPWQCRPCATSPTSVTSAPWRRTSASPAARRARRPVPRPSPRTGPCARTPAPGRRRGSPPPAGPPCRRAGRRDDLQARHHIAQLSRPGRAGAEAQPRRRCSRARPAACSSAHRSCTGPWRPRSRPGPSTWRRSRRT